MIATALLSAACSATALFAGPMRVVDLEPTDTVEIRFQSHGPDRCTNVRIKVRGIEKFPMSYASGFAWSWEPYHHAVAILATNYLSNSTWNRTMSPDEAAELDALLDYYRQPPRPAGDCGREDKVTVVWASTTETFVDTTCGAPRPGRDFLVGCAAAGGPSIAFDRIKAAKRDR